MVQTTEYAGNEISLEKREESNAFNSEQNNFKFINRSQVQGNRKKIWNH